MARTIPKPLINDKTWVSDIINFDDYEKYVEYTKDFDWEETIFLYEFLFETLKYLMTHSGDPLKITLEENVILNFQLNLTQQTIVMSYYDERMGRIVEFETIKESPIKKYYVPTPDSSSTTYVETEKHRFLNKPIHHNSKLKFSETGTHYDFDETTKSFVKEFILFANVIDKEHKEMIWLMEQKERENRLPKPPKPRIIK